MLFGFFLAFAPIAVILIAYGKYKQLPPENRDKEFIAPAFGAVAAFVAFAAWATVMPSSVFGTLSGFQTWMGTAAVILVTFLLTLAVPIFEVKNGNAAETPATKTGS